MKKVINVVLILILVLSFSSVAFAATDNLVGIENSIRVMPMSAQFEYFQRGLSVIQYLGDNGAYIEGSTLAYEDVDEIQVALYLEELSGGRWLPVCTLESTENNTNFAEVKNVVYVRGGYFYRVRTFHTVTHNGITEQGLSVTQPILIE